MASDSRRSERERFKYGICLNDECQCCKDKKVQQILMRKEFVCEECGQELRECPPQKKTNKTPLIVGAAMIAVALIGGGVFFTSNSSSGETNNNVTVTYTNQPETVESEDVPITSTKSEQTKLITPKEETKTGKEESLNTNQTSDTSMSVDGTTLKIGRYEGPMSGGKPNGIGGSINVTCSFSIDLKDGNGGSVTLEAGDRITGTKFKDGVLQQGQLIRSNGERKFLSGLSEKIM